MKRCRWLLLPACALLLWPLAAQATVDHGVFVGDDYTFGGPNNGSCLGGVCETTTSAGDPAVLWGAPTVVADSLFFSPANFTAEAIGANAFDTTGSQLQVLVSSGGSSGSGTLDEVRIREFGDSTLLGGADAYIFLSMSGFITVLADQSGAIVPVVIPFVGIASPASVPDNYYDGSTQPGNSTWEIDVIIDVASYVAGATELMISLDNDLTAGTLAGGIQAKTQKKIANGIIITVPEPATAALLGAGLLAMVGASRRRS